MPRPLLFTSLAPYQKHVTSLPATHTAFPGVLRATGELEGLCPASCHVISHWKIMDG